MSPLPCLRKVSNGYLLSLRVIPKASQNRIGELFEDGTGKCFLKLYVTSPPDKGQANKQVIEMLAKYFKIPKSTVEFISGESSRVKVIRLPESIAFPQAYK